MAGGSFQPFTLLYNEGSVTLISLWIFEGDTSISDKAQIGSDPPRPISNNADSFPMLSSSGKHLCRTFVPSCIYPLCHACRRFGHTKWNARNHRPGRVWRRNRNLLKERVYRLSIVMGLVIGRVIGMVMPHLHLVGPKRRLSSHHDWILSVGRILEYQQDPNR